LRAQYQKLRDHADQFFATVQAAFPEEMQCARGCAGCCILETVSPLEAWLIETHLASQSGGEAGRALNPAAVENDQACPFLDQEECRIYSVRPIICRTHGLAMYYPEDATLESCPLNFQTIDITSLDPKYLLNASQLTENLMRLNLAFGLITGQPEKSGERIRLTDILQRQNPAEISASPDSSDKK
jgi:Fe-S-cluster containining protein